MPRTTGTISRALPTSAPARVVKPQPRPAFNPPSPPARVASSPARAANFTAPRIARMSTSQVASQMSSAPTINPVITPRTTNACCCAACTGLQCLDRTRFFSGQLLTDADLNNEQCYLLAKNRLHNRYLHGYGVVCGLQVTCSECPGWVNIGPGYEIDPCGNDIIVCCAQSFNVLQAIQNCCTPPGQTTNCSPVRNLPPPNCQQQIQTWCITIQYQEQQSNMVTPLQSVTSSSGCACGTTSCTCGGCAGSNKMSSGGCGCGCQGNGNAGCSCSTCAASTTSSNAAACQATRILEGFQLGVCQEATLTQSINSVTGGLNNLNPGAAPFLGYNQLSNVVSSKPVFFDSNNNPTMTNSQAYQAASQYLTSAQNTYVNAGIQNCQGFADLNKIVIRQPPSPNDPAYATYAQGLQTNVNTIGTNVAVRGFELLCAAMMPPCPPPACDSRLILACVTVSDGQIINICQFGGGRKLLIGFPTIAYWLSLVWPNLGEGLGYALEKLCCDQSKSVWGGFSGDNYPRSVLTGSAGSPDMFNRAVMSYAAQIMGSAVVNAVSPQAATVDLRPLVNRPWMSVQNALVSYNILTESTASTATSNNNVTFTDVTANPAWTDDAIAAAPAYAPAAFQISNPLTIYYRGGTKLAVNTNAVAEINRVPQDAVVVGFAVTSTTDLVRNLQKQVSALQSQVSSLQTPPANPPGAAPTPTPPTPPPAPPAQSVHSTKPAKKK